MKISSAKSKGRLLQQDVADKLLAAFPFLHPDDIKSTPMSSSGEDVQLSPAARAVLGLQVECKSHAKHAVYAHYDQCSATGPHNPLVVVKANRRKPLAVVDLDWFIGLLAASNAQSS